VTIQLIQGDCLQVLKTLPDNSVQMCVTSPPYWGLRDYGTAKWEGGDAGCDHKVGRFTTPVSEKQHSNNGSGDTQARDVCPRCGAIRIDSQLGLESTPEEYVAKMVAVFREVRRVLRPDGTLWLNLASSYSSRIIESQEYIMRDDLTPEEVIYVYQELAKEKSKALSQVWTPDAQTE
jgi:DNA modification methylase